MKLLRNRWILFFLGIGFFFAVNHYSGIQVDGRLYLLQAIHYMHLDQFVNDVPFLFGNQGSFSIFSPIYGIFIRLFSVDQSSKIACFLMQLLWAFAFFALHSYGMSEVRKHRRYVC